MIRWRWNNSGGLFWIAFEFDGRRGVKSHSHEATFGLPTLSRGQTLQLPNQRPKPNTLFSYFSNQKLPLLTTFKSESQKSNYPNMLLNV